MTEQLSPWMLSMKEFLDAEAARINTPQFIADDPVQFPRMFDDLRDIEIAALLSATIAWGNRKMICRDCQKMLSLMDMQPYRYVMDEGYEDLCPDDNIHRTFFCRDLQYYLRGLRRIYQRYDSLQAFAAPMGLNEYWQPAWELARALNAELSEANGGAHNSRCIPSNLDQTALKRLNMALRWLVRNDGIVDLGVWDVISPERLMIPLDVHVGRVSRQLELLDRKSNDRKAVFQLTYRLSLMRPDDPVYYDFALFGIGMEGKINNK